MEINIWGEISLLLAFQIVFVNIFSWGLDSLGHRIFQDLDSNKKSEFIKRTTKKFFIYKKTFIVKHFLFLINQFQYIDLIE